MEFFSASELIEWEKENCCGPTEKEDLSGKEWRKGESRNTFAWGTEKRVQKKLTSFDGSLDLRLV